MTHYQNNHLHIHCVKTIQIIKYTNFQCSVDYAEYTKTLLTVFWGEPPPYSLDFRLPNISTTTILTWVNK